MEIGISVAQDKTVALFFWSLGFVLLLPLQLSQ